MEEIKGMSDHDARRYLMKHGYGLGEVDAILDTAPVADPNASKKAALMRQGYGIGEAEMLAAEESAPKVEPKPEPVKAAPAPKAKPAPALVAKAAPKPVAKPAPKASK